MIYYIVDDKCVDAQKFLQIQRKMEKKLRNLIRGY